MDMSFSFSTLVGGVNNAPLTIGIGQMLYKGPEIHNIVAPDGSLIKQVTHKFQMRSIDFNKYFWEWIRYQGAPPAPASQADPNRTPYPYVDLTKLF